MIQAVEVSVWRLGLACIRSNAWKEGSRGIEFRDQLAKIREVFSRSPGLLNAYMPGLDQPVRTRYCFAGLKRLRAVMSFVTPNPGGPGE